MTRKTRKWPRCLGGFFYYAILHYTKLLLLTKLIKLTVETRQKRWRTDLLKQYCKKRYSNFFRSLEVATRIPKVYFKRSLDFQMQNQILRPGSLRLRYIYIYIYIHIYIYIYILYHFKRKYQRNHIILRWIKKIQNRILRTFEEFFWTTRFVWFSSP